MKGEKIKPEVQLQCPKCRQFLERLEGKYLCPMGHAELNTTPEGYPILKEAGSSSRQLIYGGDFKEGALWQKALSHCRKVVYVSSSEDKEEDLKSLRDYLTSSMDEFRVVGLDELDQLKIDRQTLILFSYRVGRKNALKIILKYLGNSVYGYLPGAVIGMRLPILMRQALRAILYKFLFDPIVSQNVEACYERYLFDRGTAEHFANTYLPPEIRNGKERQAFDIGCGRGRHVAILNQLGFTVIGMDLQAHPYWKRVSKASFVIGSTECLSYIPDTTFDFVICMQVLMYLNDDDAVLTHIRRMLKHGGYLLLQVTNKENLHTVLTNEPLTLDPYLLRYYKQSELCNKLEEHGFTVDQVWNEKFYTPFFVLPGNILYEFVLNRRLQTVWDRLVNPRHLGLINILARPS